MSENRGNIVIVEDDAGLSRSVARLLRIAGFRSFCFESAERLLASGFTTPIDCFVLDIDLPGISGVDLCCKLDDAGIVRPVIFITANENSGRTVVRAGAPCLTKPFTGKALIQAIDTAMFAARM